MKRDTTGLKRDAGAPHHAAANLSALIESTEDPIWSVDLDDRLLTFNTAFYKAFERLRGVRAAVGMRPEDLLPAEMAPRWPRLYRRALSEGPFRVEMSLLRGTTLEMAFNPICQDGRPVGVSVFGKDITQRKEAEQALREAESNCRTIFESALEGIYRTSFEGKILAANPAWAVILGYDSVEEVLRGLDGSALNVWLDPNDRSVFLRLLQEKGTVLGYECQFKRRDGKGIWVAVNSRIVCDGDGRAQFIEGFAEDITGRRRAEEAQRESEERYRRVSSVTSDIVFSCRETETEEYAIEWLAGATERITGYSADELRALGCWRSIVIEEDLAKFGAHVAGLTPGASASCEMRVRHRDGSVRWLASSVECVQPRGDSTVRRIYGGLVDITPRKLAEEELRASEERHRSLFESGYDAVLFTAPDGRILTANAEACRVFRCTGQEICRMGRDRLIDPADPRLPKLLEERERTGRARGELTLLRADGTRFPGEVSSAVFRDREGNVRTVLTVRDITERKRAEDSLRDSEALQSLMLANLPAGVVIVDAATRVIERANEHVATLFGASVDHLVGQRCHALLCPACDGACPVLDLGQAVDNSERVMLRTDGSRLPILKTVKRIRLNGKDKLLECFVDLSERKRAEAALRESNERYVKAFRSAPVLVSIVSLPDGICMDVSDYGLEMSGFRREDMIGYTFVEIGWMSAADRNLLLETLDRQGGISGLELPFTARDGQTRVGLVYGEKIAVNGEDCLLTVTMDITDRKRAEVEREQLERQFHQAQKMESVGRLAGGVAHDFNNLLTVINGYSLVLLRGLAEGDPLRDGISEIYKAGERAAGLTRQLLAFSRKHILEPRPLDVNRVVADMGPMLERLVGEDIEVRLKLDAGSGTVHADPHQLEQVVMNLVVNARDAMPGTGRLLVETANMDCDARHARLHPEALAGRRYVMLAVSDTGTGMDEETKSRIFEPFFTTKGIGQGTGLGLSMVQGIVAQSGGYVEVSSEQGKGTTFKIYLPALGEPLAEGGNPAADPVLRGKETVLVVEDQEEVRKYAVAVLKAYGYRVIPVESAGEALVLCERERIDLVLTDVVMPHMSGRELADRLGTLQPDVHVLYMSGYPDNAIGHHGVLEKGVKFIQKPFSPEDLARKVREVLGLPPRAGLD